MLTEVTALVPQLPSPVVELRDERLREHDVTLYLKRDDLIHSEIPGNKWRKLKYNLEALQMPGADTVLTFGGAYSNHLRAVAAAGRFAGFRTIGAVRGERHCPLNESLKFCVDRGMQLIYLDRKTYRRKNQSAMLESLREEFGSFYLLPEGGSNELAVKGCLEIAAEIDIDFDYICCPVGTGGTLAGLAAGLHEGQYAIGFSSLRGGGFLNEDVARLQRAALGRMTGNWRIDLDHHFGGFAKRTQSLDEFIEWFSQTHSIVLDWVYVAKMMYGVFDLADRGDIPSDSRVVALITG